MIKCVLIVFTFANERFLHRQQLILDDLGFEIDSDGRSSSDDDDDVGSASVNDVVGNDGFVKDDVGSDASVGNEERDNMVSWLADDRLLRWLLFFLCVTNSSLMINDWSMLMFRWFCYALKTPLRADKICVGALMSRIEDCAFGSVVHKKNRVRK